MANNGDKFIAMLILGLFQILITKVIKDILGKYIDLKEAKKRARNYKSRENK